MIKSYIDQHFYYLSASTPKEVKFERISPHRIKDLNDYPVYSLNPPPSDSLDLICIDGDYYFNSRGMNLVSQVQLALSDLDAEIPSRVQYYDDNQTLISNFESLYGPIENYNETVDRMIFGESLLSYKDNRTLIEKKESINEADLFIIENNVEVFLTNFIKNYETVRNPQTPLILGHSGASKSSIVYSIANKLNSSSEWGYRVVMIKAGFLSKADFLGFVHIDNIEINGTLTSVAKDAPMKEFLTSCDSFVNACRNIVTQYKSVDESTLTPEDKKSLEIIREYAKTPIIFLDEVNRTPSNIMNVLMVIMNQKRLDRYTFHKAPIVCAANWAIDISNDELLEMYTVEMLDDPAQIDRFVVLKMSHKDHTVLVSAVNHLSEKYQPKWPYSMTVEKMLNSAMGLDVLHNPELMFDASTMEGDDLDKKFEMKFPTFRGWEDFIKYAISQHKRGYLISDYVYSLFGYKAGDVIVKAFQKVFTFKTAEELQLDSHDMVLQESYQAGVPCLLTGRFGLAKTAKVSQLAEKEDGYLYNIDLSSADRVAVRGYPDRKNILEAVLGPSLITSTVAGDLIKESSKDPLFPKDTTEFIGFDTAYVVAECLKNNKPLIIMFDEVLRTDPILLSSVFEAISEKKLKGIDISELVDRGLVRVVAATNVGSSYSITRTDAALSGRFASVRKDVVTEYDKEAFKKWVMKNCLPEVATAIIDALDTIVEIINNFDDNEEIDISSTLNSFRQFDSLNSFVSNNYGFLVNFSEIAGSINYTTYIHNAISNRYLAREYNTSLRIGYLGEQYTIVSFLDYLKDNLERIKKDPAEYDEAFDAVQKIDMYCFNNHWRPGLERVLGEGSKLMSAVGIPLEHILYKKLAGKEYLTNDSIAASVLSYYANEDKGIVDIDEKKVIDLVLLKIEERGDSGKDLSEILSSVQEIFQRMSEIVNIPVPRDSSLLHAIHKSSLEFSDNTGLLDSIDTSDSSGYILTVNGDNFNYENDDEKNFIEFLKNHCECTHEVSYNLEYWVEMYRRQELDSYKYAVMYPPMYGLSLLYFMFDSPSEELFQRRITKTRFDDLKAFLAINMFDLRTVHVYFVEKKELSKHGMKLLPQQIRVTKMALGDLFTMKCVGMRPASSNIGYDVENKSFISIQDVMTANPFIEADTPGNVIEGSNVGVFRITGPSVNIEFSAVVLPPANNNFKDYEYIRKNLSDTAFSKEFSGKFADAINDLSNKTVDEWIDDFERVSGYLIPDEPFKVFGISKMGSLFMKDLRLINSLVKKI